MESMAIPESLLLDAHAALGKSSVKEASRVLLLGYLEFLTQRY